MTAISEYLRTLGELFKIFILAALFSIGGISFPVDATAAGTNAVGKEGAAGGIIIGRDVPQRSAFRPSIVPGRANVVDTSPDDTVKSATGANKRMTSFNELSEKDFAAITTDSPLRHISSQVNDGFAGAGTGSNVMQSTAGISSTLGGSSGGAISNSVTRATSTIGPTITGAMGFLK